MAYIIDIVLIAVFALVIFVSAKKGFFVSLFEHKVSYRFNSSI